MAFVGILVMVLVLIMMVVMLIVFLVRVVIMCEFDDEENGSVGMVAITLHHNHEGKVNWSGIDNDTDGGRDNQNNMKIMMLFCGISSVTVRIFKQDM